MSEKPTIPGAICIFSCHKHMNTRMQLFGLKNPMYTGWPVFYFIGNPYLSSDYTIYHNLVILKCEDSYIHVAKKVALGIGVMYSLFNITEGILRCGDDLYFDVPVLERFLKGEKTDYMGYSADMNETIKNVLYTNMINNFMPRYYETHLSELSDPMHGINKTIEEIRKYNIVPKCNYAGGVVVYLSTKSCMCILNHFQSIGWDVFKLEENIGYPYIIEDVAIGVILLTNEIYLTNVALYSDNNLNKNEHTFAMHTNAFK